MLSKRLAGLLVGGSLFAAAAAPVHAGVVFVGTQQDIELHNSDGSTGWRVSDVSHIYATTPAKIYGTDGYDIFTTTALAIPTYIDEAVPGNPATAITFAPGIAQFGPSNGYASIDNPTGAGAIFTGTAYVNGAAPGTTPMFSFTVNATAIKPIRIGLLYDNTDNSGGLAGNAFIVSGPGATSDTSGVTVTGNTSPDWYFFDISGAGTYTVSINNTNVGANNIQVGGISFDSVPEPTSLSLLGLGALGLLARRSRRSK